jgi:hypothetical protein
MRYLLACVALVGLSTNFAQAATIAEVTAVPEVRATAIAKREEHSTIDCDKKADQAKVSGTDRFSFFEKCLAGEPQVLK